MISIAYITNNRDNNTYHYWSVVTVGVYFIVDFIDVFDRPNINRLLFIFNIIRIILKWKKLLVLIYYIFICILLGIAYNIIIIN